MPKLVSESKEVPSIVVELVGPRMAVGRIDENQIQVVHGSISSRHAELLLDGAEYRVRDLDSTNGTRVNEEKVSEVLLQDRDRVQFGQIHFRYEGATPRAALALPVPGANFRAEIGTESGVPENFRNLSPIKGKGKGKDPNLILWVGAGVALLGLGFYVFRLISVL